MILGITGATGFVGQQLLAQAKSSGYQVVAFTRRADRTIAGADETRAFADDAPPNVGGLNAIVHLAGESVLGLWTQKKRKAIYDSRINNMKALVTSLAGLEPQARPRVLVCASAVGWYGDRGDDILTENEPAGIGFLAEVTKDWEAVSREAESLGIRVVRLRIGLVLGKTGGGWPLLHRIFSLGLGGRLGSGQQWMPWVHIDDVVGLALHSVLNDHVTGPLNTTAPEPVINADYTRLIAQAVTRPAFFHTPGWVLRLALRDQASMFLNSNRCAATAALATGYRFRYHHLKEALAQLTT